MKSSVLTSKNLNSTFKNESYPKNLSNQKTYAKEISGSYSQSSNQNKAQNNPKISPAYVYEKGSSDNDFYGKIVYKIPQNKIHISQHQEDSIKALSNHANNSTAKKITGTSTLESVFRKLENFTNGIGKKISEHLKKTEINTIRTKLKEGLEALRHVTGNNLKYAINFFEHALQDKPSDIRIEN
ncbi:hypothetical protein [Caldicellulosiruptor morganii]|uniref:Uncharacterized protein n=1 Tax=Caldicellulosiruptor morganii TaxID=1387555 RepID=A0ABY7BRS0_9FIRM|nr:hypothetical protein [Caldicellulosiruptor morganii]WAM34224.1 hypothetical protein OTK00_000403 [Caldicellulosiruptor morganii]